MMILEGHGGQLISSDTKNIENAIHYFLHDDIAPNFMEKNLNWELIQTKNKQRLFKIKFIDKYIKFPFHNIVGRFLSYLIDPMFLKKDNNIFVKTLGLLKKYIKRVGKPHIMSKVVLLKL